MMVARSIAVACIFMLSAHLPPTAAHRMLLQASGGANDAGDLFILAATSATMTSGDNYTMSLQMDGVRPQTIWSADKPFRTGGQLNTSDLLGKDFLQNGQWMANPNIVLYSSDGRSGDMVISLAIMSNPQIINATSVLFPVVSNQANSNQKPSSMAAFYEGSEPHMDMGRGYIHKGPYFVNPAGTNGFVFTAPNVAMFVDPWYCGCGCFGVCGCGQHYTPCLG